MGTEASIERQPENPPAPRLIGVTAAAEYLGMDPSTIYRLCTARKIRHRRVGCGSGRIVFDRSDLDAYLDACVVEVGEPTDADGLPPLKHIDLTPRRPSKRPRKSPAAAPSSGLP